MPAAKRTFETLGPHQGRDLLLQYSGGTAFFEDADVLTARRDPRQPERDLELVSGIDNLTQALANRLKTRRGELAALGHPDYGSRHHELIGEPNTDRTRNLIKLYILQALRDEPRVERVLAVKVSAEQQPPRATVRIEMSLRVLGEASPLNLVLPFSLEIVP